MHKWLFVLLQMIMFLNGRNQGVAFEDFYDGIYYPAISLYKNATVGFNDLIHYF